eukprot:3941129-Rhodomonas_salina.9
MIRVLGLERSEGGGLERASAGGRGVESVSSGAARPAPRLRISSPRASEHTASHPDALSLIHISEPTRPRLI